MKSNLVLLSVIVAACSAASAQAAALQAGTLCAGAATLNNGTIVTIGQPFVGVMSAPDGSVTVSSGILPTLLPSANSGGTPVIDPKLTMQNGQFQFSFATQPGHNYVVQASTNLWEWTPIWTNAGTWTGLQFQDAEAWLYPWRFYRVKSD